MTKEDKEIKKITKESQKIVEKSMRRLKLVAISCVASQELKEEDANNPFYDSLKDESYKQALEEISAFVAHFFPSRIGFKKFYKLCKKAMKGNVETFEACVETIGNGLPFHFEINVSTDRNTKNGMFSETLPEGGISTPNHIQPNYFGLN